MTEARTTRAAVVQPRMPRVNATAQTLYQRSRLSSTIAASSSGMPSTMSTTREASASNQPPKYPAGMPMPNARMAANRVDSMPTSIEARAPYTERA